MKTKWIATSLFAGAALAVAPLAAYAADTKDTSSMTKTEKAKDYIDDATITTKVKTELAKDKQVSATKIKVETDHGVVKLTGSASSKEEADKAAAIAQGTKGVASVDNKIEVGGAAKKY